MDRIQSCADLSVSRGCSFGYLAIATAMVGMAWDMSLAMKMGAIGASFMLVVLLMKGLRAPIRNYRHTEVWILLDKQHGLPEPRAQQVIGNALRDCYLRHATLVAIAATTLWLLAFGLYLFGRGPVP